MITADDLEGWLETVKAVRHDVRHSRYALTRQLVEDLEYVENQMQRELDALKPTTISDMQKSLAEFHARPPEEKKPIIDALRAASEAFGEDDAQPSAPWKHVVPATDEP